MTTLPLFPLGTVLFPAGRLILQVFEPRYLDLVRDSLKRDQPFGIVLIREGNEVVRSGTDPMPRLSQIGTCARIVDWDAGEHGQLAVTVEGTTKFRLLSTRQEKNYLVRGEVETLPPEPQVALPAEAADLPDLLQRLALHPTVARLGMTAVGDDAGRVSYQLAQLLPLAPAEQFALLVEADVGRRLERLLRLVDDLAG